MLEVSGEGKSSGVGGGFQVERVTDFAGRRHSLRIFLIHVPVVLWLDGQIRID